jgi:shikimate 5-dehydrogenase
VVDGLEVLVHQGARSLARWTGRTPPLEVMRKAAFPFDAHRRPV